VSNHVWRRALAWLGFSAAHFDHHGHGHGVHRHSHGVIDPSIATTERGLWAVKWSFVGLMITGLLQVVVVVWSGSVALFADTVHNFADALTAVPLWVAFVLARRPPSRTFTYGFGRVEDLAGAAVVLIILFSAVVAGHESIDRLVHPRPIELFGWVAVAGAIGFLGNELVAAIRIRVGREIHSAALIADGYHARTDGLTSLAVVVGAIGVALGYPAADPLVGLLITTVILGIVWQSARAIFTRMLDGVDPRLVDDVRHTAEHVRGIRQVLDVKARWLGHRLHVDVAIDVDRNQRVSEAEALVAEFRHELRRHIPALANANIRVGQ
jgi:cation diffusion facilitator family transporter